MFDEFGFHKVLMLARRVVAQKRAERIFTCVFVKCFDVKKTEAIKCERGDSNPHTRWVSVPKTDAATITPLSQKERM